MKNRDFKQVRKGAVVGFDRSSAPCLSDKGYEVVRETSCGAFVVASEQHSLCTITEARFAYYGGFVVGTPTDSRAG